MKQFREVKIIKQESEAKTRSSMNILPVGDGLCKLIFIDECGEKITVESNVPDNIALVDLFNEEGDLIEEGNVYLKSQIDKFISYFANKNASNLSQENINDWKQKLGVGDLPENIATYDYDIHNHVMMKDGTIKEAADLGKNIANSSLTSVAGAGMTLGVPYVWNTSGQPYSITNLSDKSADATFATMLVQNASGQVAKSNGKPFIKSMPALLTESEKTIWKTEMNGGWTTNTMSVFLINPIVVNNIDRPVYFIMYGLNLNLNPINFSLEILKEDGITLVETIDNSQVQLYDQQIVFYTNVFNYELAKYKVRLNNGVATYVTPVSFEVAANVEQVNTNLLTWQRKVLNDYDSTDNPVIVGSSGRYKIDRNIKEAPPNGTQDFNPVVVQKSTPLFSASDNFYLEATITMLANGVVNGAWSQFNFFFGLTNSSHPLSLFNTSIINLKMITNLGSYTFVYPDNGVDAISFQGAGQFSLIIIRSQGTYNITIRKENKIVTFNRPANDEEVSLLMGGSNGQGTGEFFDFSIISAYKF